MTIYGGLSLIEEYGADVGHPRYAAEIGWARSLRHFARIAVWSLPIAAICLALAGVWGWPTASAVEPSGQSPGTWLVVTLFGLILGLVGVLAMAALLSATAGRVVSVVALVSVLIGTVLLAPVLGVMGLALPAVARGSAQPPPVVLDGTVIRWLGVGGLCLLGVGWFALGCAVLASRALNRVDGYLTLAAVALGVLSALLSWQFLLAIAAMALLAAGLGLAWTASRLTPDGDPSDD